MPMKSDRQRRWMWANDPEMAKRWEEHTPKNKKLPEKVKSAYYTAGRISALQHMGRKGE